MTTRQPRSFVVVHDEPDGSLTFATERCWFDTWDTTTRSDLAMVFFNRPAAVRLLHHTGKHREGWRVLKWT
jgi:hypothetical protein